MILIEDDLLDASDLVIGPGELTPVGQEWTVPPTGLVLKDVECQLILSALKQAGNNKSMAARLLGLTRDTLRYHMEKHKLLS
jgi:DNA-binding NtrC family response regulator